MLDANEPSSPIFGNPKCALKVCISLQYNYITVHWQTDKFNKVAKMTENFYQNFCIMGRKRSSWFRRIFTKVFDRLFWVKLGKC